MIGAKVRVEEVAAVKIRGVGSEWLGLLCRTGSGREVGVGWLGMVVGTEE